jgi:hypothetical protein
VGTLDLAGQGSCIIAFPSAATRDLTAQYPGDATFEGDTSVAVSHTVTKAATTITVTSVAPPSPADITDQVTVNYTLAVTAPGVGVPTGSVSVTDGTATCLGAAAVGVALNCKLTFTTGGEKDITATYLGDANFEGSASAPFPYTVTFNTATATITQVTPSPSALNQPVTVDFTVTGSGGTPSGDVTVSDNAGTQCTATVAQGTWELTFTTTGSKTLTASYQGDAVFGPATSAGVAHTVNAFGAADSLGAVSSLTPTGAAGGPATPNPTVIVLDAFGNPVSGASVSFTPGADNGSVSPTSPVSTGSDGQASVTWTLGPGTGTQTLTVTSGTLKGSPITFTANATVGAASASQTTAAVPAGTAGSPTTITITVRDANGNVRTGGGDEGLLAVTVTGANTDSPTIAVVGGGVYSATYTPTASGADDVAITLSGTDISDSPYTSVVSPGAAASLDVTGIADPVTAGVASNLTVTARDAQDNVATGYTGTVTFASSDTQATLPPNYQFTGADAGVHTFSVTLATAGEQAVTATDNANGSLTDSQVGITVDPAQASAAGVNGGDGQSAVVATPVVEAPSVVVTDAFGNRVSGVAVTFTPSPDGGVTGGSATTDASGIAAVGSWILGTAAVMDSDTLTASVSGVGDVTIVASATPGPASLATSTVEAAPDTVGALGSSTITVRLFDQFGNALAGSGGTVEVFANGTPLSAVNDNGDGTYSATFTAGLLPETVTITARLDGGDLTDTATVTVEVIAG